MGPHPRMRCPTDTPAPPDADLTARISFFFCFFNSVGAAPYIVEQLFGAPRASSGERRPPRTTPSATPTDVVPAWPRRARTLASSAPKRRGAVRANGSLFLTAPKFVARVRRKTGRRRFGQRGREHHHAQVRRGGSHPGVWLPADPGLRR